MINITSSDDFWYVPSPYSRYPEGRDAAFRAVTEPVSILLNAGIIAFSPILHSHDLANMHNLPTDYKFWKEWNHSFIRVSAGLIIPTLPTWDDSEGVKDEIAYAYSLNKPILYMNAKGPAPFLPASKYEERPSMKIPSDDLMKIKDLISNDHTGSTKSGSTDGA